MYTHKSFDLVILLCYQTFNLSYQLSVLMFVWFLPHLEREMLIFDALELIRGVVSISTDKGYEICALICSLMSPIITIYLFL